MPHTAPAPLAPAPSTPAIHRAPKQGVPYPTPALYTDRDSKARYIADKYRAILGGSVLDVGCDRKLLQRELGAAVRYVGVDMSQAADVRVNLDKEPLPFANRSFDTVLAADVLEHLERIHDVFDALCRIADSRVIVSLPNPVRNLLLALAAGQTSNLKHYGLPLEAPQDRHRWFFGAEEAAAFMRDRGARNGFEVEQMDVDEWGVPPWLNEQGANLLGSRNVSLGTTWCVLRREA